MLEDADCISNLFSQMKQSRGRTGNVGSLCGRIDICKQLYINQIEIGLVGGGHPIADGHILR